MVLQYRMSIAISAINFDIDRYDAKQAASPIRFVHLVHSVHFAVYCHLCCIFAEITKIKSMISPVIIELLSHRLGKDIRYPADCEVLSYDIERKINQHIGVTTLKRLLGFVKDVKQPRWSTLDIIAQYLGFDSYNKLLKSLLSRDNISGFEEINELRPGELRVSDRLVVTYSPDRRLVLQYISDNRFRVIESANSKLIADDEIAVSCFLLHHPLYVGEVVRNGNCLGSYIAAKISGLASITLLPSEK